MFLLSHVNPQAPATRAYKGRNLKYPERKQNFSNSAVWIISVLTNEVALRHAENRAWMREMLEKIVVRGGLDTKAIRLLCMAWAKAEVQGCAQKTALQKIHKATEKLIFRSAGPEQCSGIGFSAMLV